MTVERENDVLKSFGLISYVIQITEKRFVVWISCRLLNERNKLNLFPTCRFIPIYHLSNERLVKGTVSVILSDPPCKDANARFTTVPLKALSDQVWIRYSCFFLFFLHLIFTSSFSVKVTGAFLALKKRRRNFTN